jgi:uracil-DNA glycosylase
MRLSEEEIIAIKLEPNWKMMLRQEFEKPYFYEIKQFLLQERSKGKIIYPASSNIFSAFNNTAFNKVKVVILGQDPYHGVGQAMGLSFSVPKEVSMPPSLKNIFKELQDDVLIPYPEHGNLNFWASQGVLLLNSILTVEANIAASHSTKGWQTFTDEAIKILSKNSNGIVFMLWGNYAKMKKNLIDENKHYILEASHPSPFSAYNGFFGCKHFSKCNALLIKDGKVPIDWRVI